MSKAFAALVALCASCLAAWPLAGSPPAADPPAARSYAPFVAEASGEAALAARTIQVPDGLRVDLFAAEPMLANPVCFCTDNRGRFYVAETFRLLDGVSDDREHMEWLDDDLACRTVAERVAVMKKYLGPRAADWAVEHERVRLIEDTKGQGRADRSTVFADGFHGLEDGIGAGLVARDGGVWYTCIPNLWLLRDSHGTGRADVRRALQHGYGVHTSFVGHDLHGLCFGPDGKLYFSIGDRGLNVRTPDRTVSLPDTGAVLRCNPDGSELELVHTGLRNPQELAFDQYGNLFTGDNNADHGDKARWVHVVEGGDSGWRIGYQYMNRPTALGPWNAEKLWQTRWEGQAAYLLPPVAHLADGPAGLAYYPGTGQLPERYREHFFLCDFRGSSGQSGIHAFAVKPRGASFEMIDAHRAIWSVLATDVEFGSDGALYVLDWVEGWKKTGKGRIYKVHDPKRAADPVVREVQRLLAEGMAQRSTDELARLLAHADMRIRQAAQFALAERGKAALDTLAEVARPGHPQLARLHAIWGLGQVGRKVLEAHRPLFALLRDSDAEVRAQAARVVGDAREAAAYEPLRTLLADPQPRVQFFAALALAKLSRKEAVAPVVEMLRRNADRDAYLRHAGVMALVGAGDREALRSLARDPAAAVRLAVLLVYRRLESPDVAQFLDDPEPRLVLEAARAIYDVPIADALPRLAALVTRPQLSEPLAYRVLNANFRLGGTVQAAALARFAARADVSDTLRVEALQELADWRQPSGRDRVVGLWRPLAAREVRVAADALQPYLPVLFRAPDSVREEAARTAARLGIREASPQLWACVTDPQSRPAVRVEALKALEHLHDGRLADGVKRALDDRDVAVRTEAQRILAALDPAAAIPHLAQVLDHGSVAERQGALAILGGSEAKAADALLDRWLERLRAGRVAVEIQLDLLEAVGHRSEPRLKEELARYEAARAGGGTRERYREVLAGGDAKAGRKLFFEKSETNCLRCHKVHASGGDVGPDLAGIGSRQDRPYLLEAIVEPNKEIAKGYETTVLLTSTGQVYSGIIKSEDERALVLITAEGKLLHVRKDQIEERQRGKSAMPEDLIKSLSKRELRDLIEYLASLKQGAPANATDDGLR
jgi:quinoprotein glucose dehydrogenase